MLLSGKGWRFVGAFVAFAALLAGPALAQNLLTVRVESLDAAMGDITTLAAAVGKPVEKEAVLAPLTSSLGLQDLSFLDWKAPAALVMPMQAMMLQHKGILLALPVADAGKAIEILTGKFASHAVEEDVHVFGTETGPALFVAERDGYLAAGGTKDLVRTFDVRAALARPDAPPGNLVVDFNLEPIAPMAMMGMMQGREMAKQQMKAAMEQDEHVPAGMADMMASMVDMYLDVAQAWINNTSRIQLVPQIDGGHVVGHLRVIPKSGSTLAGLVAAQKASWPSVARYVPADAVFVGAGQMTMTPAVKEAFKGFAGRYFDALGKLGAAAAPAGQAPAQGDAPAEGEPDQHEQHMQIVGRLLSSMPAEFRQLYLDNLDCQRGDMAFALDFDAEKGASLVQVAGLNTSTQGCADMTSRALGMVRDWLAKVPEISSFVGIGPVAGGTWAIDLNLAPHLAQAPPEAAAMLNQLLLDDGKISIHMGQTKDMSYAAFGKNAAARAAELASGKPGGGLTQAAFGPIPAGAGYFFRVDVGRLLSAIRSVIPEGEEGAAGREKLASVAQAFAGPAGRVPIALRFDSSGMNLEVAVSLQTLQAVAGLAQYEEAQGEEAEEHAGKHPEGGAS